MRKKSSSLELNECREVELRIIFFRIGEIDTLNEKFFAEILIESKWQEPRLHTEFDLKPSKMVNGCYIKEEKQLFQPNKYWNPKIYVENILSEPNETISYKIKREMTTKVSQSNVRNLIVKNDEKYDETNNFKFIYWIYEYRKIKGYFFEKLDLKYFPVDIQNMSVTVTSYRSNREIVFTPNKSRQSIVNSKINIDNNIWHLFQQVETITNGNKKEIFRNDESNVDEKEMQEFLKHLQFEKNPRSNDIDPQIKFPIMIFKCKAARHSGYFYWNAFLPTLLITSSVFTIFSIDPDKPQFRLPTTATLLLTSIMFKWSYSTRHLPTVNYLTSLDKYSIISLVFVYLCLTWHGIAYILFNFFDIAIVFSIDRAVFVILLLTYLLIQFILLGWLRTAYVMRNHFKSKESDDSNAFSRSLFLLNSTADGDPNNIEPNFKFGSVISTLHNIDQINNCKRQRNNSLTDHVKSLMGKSKNSSLVKIDSNV